MKHCVFSKPAILLLLAAGAVPCLADDIINVDFAPLARNAIVEGHNGNVFGPVFASGLGKEDRAKILAKIQANLDGAYGAGKVKVQEGRASKATDVIISGGEPPPGAAETAGTSGGEGNDFKPQPAIVFAGVYTKAKFTQDEVNTGVATTAGHEIGHTRGLGHNTNSPADKMTGGRGKDGKPVLKMEDEKTDKSYNDEDKKKLQKNLSVNNAEQKEEVSPTDIGVEIGNDLGPLTPDGLLPDITLDAQATFTGSASMEFGYLSSTQEFVFEGDTTNTLLSPSFLSFVRNGGVDFAVRVGNDIFALSNGFASFTLQDPNANDLRFFSTAKVSFDTSAGMAQLLVTTAPDYTTGGFYAVPEPSLAILSAGVALFGAGFLARHRVRIHKPVRRSAR